MYNRSRQTWTAKKLIKETEAGNIDFDIAIQRGDAWSRQQSSLFINSLIIDCPVPDMFFINNGNGKYDALDGKQRTYAIIKFVRGKYSLHVSTPSVINKAGEEIQITRMYFNDLPEEFQDNIMDYNLGIVQLNGVTLEEGKEAFTRLNGGTPLSSIELMRVKVAELDKFQRLSKHPAIDKAITAIAKKKFKNEQLAMQIYVAFTNDYPDFSIKTLRTEIGDATVTNEQVIRIETALDYIDALYLSYAKHSSGTKIQLANMKKPTHVVSLAYAADYAIDHEITVDEYIEKVKDFFVVGQGKTTISEAYNEAARSGTGRAEAVKIRFEEILKIFR